MKRSIPNWARDFLADSAIDKVRQAVAEAEKLTSAEIVPMVVRRSSTIGHVRSLFLLMVWSALLLIDPAALLGWEAEPFLCHGLYLGFSLALSLAGSRWTWLQRLLTSPADREWQVDMRAEVEFYEAGLNNTAGRTGVLLFVSLMEHRVTVLADKAIQERLPDNTWNEVLGLVLAGIKESDLEAGLVRGIHRCGELLTQPFPIASDDRNELRNDLIIKE